jgi:hypothetical protein
VCLKFLSPWVNEDLSMKPESDPSAALTVSRGTETGVSGTTGLSLSQTPSANVSLGLNRNKTLTVEYALKTWSLSAHRIGSGTIALNLSAIFILLGLTSFPEPVDVPEAQTLSSGKIAESKLNERPVYQWFWSGTHGDSRTLTPDLKHTVKRHVVVKRSIPVTQLRMREKKVEVVKSVIAASDSKGMGNDDVDSTDNPGEGTLEDGKRKSRATAEHASLYSLDDLLNFSFLIQVCQHLIYSIAGQLTRMVRSESNADLVACIELLS